MTESTEQKVKGQAVWLVYVAAVLAGLILLSDAFSFGPIQRLTARLGIGLVWSAFALIIANGRASGYIATGILWVAVLITFFV